MLTPKIKTITVHTPDNAQPFIALGIQGPDADLVIPLDLEAAEAFVSSFVSALGDLRQRDDGTWARAQQAAAQAELGIKPNDRVEITAGAVSGRKATVVAVEREKVTVTNVEGLLPNEQLQLLPGSVRVL